MPRSASGRRFHRENISGLFPSELLMSPRNFCLTAKMG
jgi:hypothetical protein